MEPYYEDIQTPSHGEAVWSCLPFTLMHKRKKTFLNSLSLPNVMERVTLLQRRIARESKTIEGNVCF